MPQASYTLAWLYEEHADLKLKFLLPEQVQENTKCLDLYQQ